MSPLACTLYAELHARGHAHSVESWNEDGRLIGGLFGVDVGGVFCGESMFSFESGGSKIALISLVRHLDLWGYEVFDWNYMTSLGQLLGVVEIPRQEYLTMIAPLVNRTNSHQWALDDQLDLLIRPNREC